MEAVAESILCDKSSRWKNIQTDASGKLHRRQEKGSENLRPLDFSITKETVLSMSTLL
jgi:hypothetical protein